MRPNHGDTTGGTRRPDLSVPKEQKSRDHGGTWGPDHEDPKGGTRGQTCRSWEQSHLIMMAPKGRIMGTRKVAQRGQTCRLRKAKVIWLREANTVQQKDHDGA